MMVSRRLFIIRDPAENKHYTAYRSPFMKYYITASYPGPGAPGARYSLESREGVRCTSHMYSRYTFVSATLIGTCFLPLSLYVAWNIHVQIESPTGDRRPDRLNRNRTKRFQTRY